MKTQQVKTSGKFRVVRNFMKKVSPNSCRVIKGFICILFFGFCLNSGVFAIRQGTSGFSADFNLNAGYAFLNPPTGIAFSALQSVGWRIDNNYFGIGIDVITSQIYSDISRNGFFGGGGPEYHRFFYFSDSWYLRYGPTFSMGSFQKRLNKDVIDYYAFGYSAIWQTSIGLQLTEDPANSLFSAYYFSLELVTALTYNNVFDHIGRADNEMLNAYVGLKLNFLWDLEPLIKLFKELRRRS